MNLKRTWAVGAFLLAAALPASALAAPTDADTSTPSAGTGAPPRSRRAHASLRLDVGQAKPWVGQPLPVTVTAFFRDVEGVTLEGALQLTSKGIITSELARDPQQATAIIEGQPTVVVTWKGTVTPSSPGPLDLGVALPVRIRYRDAAPRVIVHEPQDADPFADFDADPFGPSVFDKLRKRMHEQMQQMVEQPIGRLHEEAMALKATARPVEALALPVADQPSTFSGAVGQFDLAAAVSAIHGRVSEPVTLRIAVEGTGDLDRVDLPGVATSDEWKAYPPKAITEAAPAAPRRGRPRKIFEQVLVPLRSGDLNVPAVSLSAFDPSTGTYVTRSSAPIAVSVEGAAVATETPSHDAIAPAAPPAAAPLLPRVQAVVGRAIRIVTPERIGAGVGAVLLFGLVLGLISRLAKTRGERSLRRIMRRAAKGGGAEAFLGSAHELIATRLAKQWGVTPQDVTARSIRERLGEEGAPLAEVLAADEALRFGRGGMPDAALGPLCSSIERSLRAARPIRAVRAKGGLESLAGLPK